MNSFFKTFLASFLGALLALIISFFFFILIIGSIAMSTSTEAAPTVPNGAILRMDLDKLVVAERTTDSFSDFTLTSLYTGGGSSTLGIYDAVKAIERAATDPNINMIYITQNGGINMGVSYLEEIRDALKEFRNSGKPIIAYGMNFSQGGYYLSSVADRIYMNEDGNAMIAGIGANILFFKDLIDKLGVDFQLIRHGKFKAAAEQFTNSNISAENREQNEVLYGSIWDCWAEDICKERNINIDSLNYAIDNLLLSDAESMLNKSLIDSTITANRMYQKLCELNNDKPNDGYKYITLSKYSKATNTQSYKKNKIAVIFADGEIVTDGSGLSVSTYVPIIKRVAKDSSIKAVVLRVNSPGGDAQAAELIREELQLLKEKKPLVISYGEYAASGGYWISAQGSQIFTDKTTITGSIGVFSMAFSVGNALKKNFGINSYAVKTHKHASMGAGIDKLDDTEIKYFQDGIENVYDKFTKIVADGRNLSVGQVDSIGQGRIWSGVQAVENRLADRVGGIKEAVEYAKQLVNESDPAAISIVEYPKQKSQFESFMDILNSKEDVSMELQLLKFIKQYKGVNTFVRLPYVYQVSY